MVLPSFDLFDDEYGVGAAEHREVARELDVEQLSAELGELAEGHRCPRCRRDPGHRFEVLRNHAARLHPEARDRLELVALAGHLAWSGR